MLKEKRKLWLFVGIGGLCALVILGVLLALVCTKPDAPTPTEPAQTTLPAPSENPLGVMDFGYSGGYLTCLTRPSLLGIDVSTHQGQIDWQQVKAAGIEFVMLRLGYRGTDLGGLYADEMLQSHYAGAKAAGLKIGGYFFSQATDEEEARQEAAYALELTRDMELDMPIVYDWEDTGPDSRVAQVDAKTVTDCALAFCKAITDSGRKTMVYFNPQMARQRLELERLTDHGFWLAMYSDEMTFQYRVDMWQYTCTGAVPGIEGDVDINLYFPE